MLVGIKPRVIILVLKVNLGPGLVTSNNFIVDVICYTIMVALLGAV